MRSQLSFALLFAGSAIACTNGSSSQQVAQDLAQPNGGFTYSNEEPEFGEVADFNALQLETDSAVVDPIASDPTVAALDATPAPAVDGRDVIIVWGKIPADPDATVTRDWSGSLSVSRGALYVRRTISFDAGDHLLPRTSPEVVPFVSYTRPWVDGLSLRVLDPSPSTADPLVITYQSSLATPGGGSGSSSSSGSGPVGPITYTFNLDQLTSGPIVIDAGDGFKMVAVGVHKDTVGCAGGFMRGRFHALGNGDGEFRGLVTDRIGVPVGHVKGIYGMRPAATSTSAASTSAASVPMLFGKFIDLQGEFMGVFAGSYDATGDFAAEWKVPGDDVHGVIHGHYADSTAVDGGVFLARWAQAGCSDDAPVSSSGGGSGGSTSAPN
jgi:hypothetical protein